MADAGNAVEIAPPASRRSTANMPEANVLPQRHVVQRGESTWSIARQYHVAAADLIRLNGLDKRGAIKPGMELKLQD